MNRRDIRDAFRFLQQKTQAVFGSVGETDDVGDVNDFLRGKPARAISLHLSPEQIKAMDEAHKGLNDILSRHNTEINVLSGIRATCNSDAPAILTENGLDSGLSEDAMEEIHNAELKLINTYRDAVERGFDEKPYEIAYLTGLRGHFMHNHSKIFRFATYSLGDPKETTEYPGLGQNRRGPENTALFFGGDFWHSTPENDRPVIIAESVPGKHF